MSDVCVSTVACVLKTKQKKKWWRMTSHVTISKSTQQMWSGGGGELVL